MSSFPNLPRPSVHSRLCADCWRTGAVFDRIAACWCEGVIGIALHPREEGVEVANIVNMGRADFHRRQEPLELVPAASANAEVSHGFLGGQAQGLKAQRLC
jgi:hypothetical protein